MRFSISEGMGAAFSLVRRRPAAVFVWGFLIIGPMLLFLPMMLTFMSDMVASMEVENATAVDTANAVFPTSAFAGMMGMQAGMGLLNLLQMLAMVVVYPAIMRAVIRPEERSWFSLRVSMDEVRVAVVAIVVFGGLYMVLMFAMLLAIISAAIATSLGASHVAVGVTIAVVLVVLVVAILCAFVPLSLMAPASLYYRRFAFAEGWRLAKNQWVRLIGLHLTIMVVIIAIEIGLGILIVSGGLIVVSTGIDWSWIHAGTSENPFVDFKAILATWWPLMVGVGLVICAVYGLILTVSVAPVASACAQLARRHEINSVSG